MNAADETELHRLCGQLKQISEHADTSAQGHEALRKSAFALQRIFAQGGRAQIEAEFNAIDQPLTETQRDHLWSLGLDPGLHGE